MIAAFLAGCALPIGLLAPNAPPVPTEALGRVELALAATQSQNAARSRTQTSAPMGSPSPTSTPTRKPSSTPFPTATIMDTLTPIADKLLISVSVETHCRNGPGKAYAPVSALPAGGSAEIVARDPTGHYWYILDPDRGSFFCWVWDGYATFSADTSRIPVFTPAPTVIFTPRPSVTPDFVRMVQAGPSGREKIYQRPDTGTISVGFVYDGELVTLLPQPLNPRGRPFARAREFNYIESSQGVIGWVRILSDGASGWLTLVMAEDWVPFGKRKAEPRR